MKSFISILISMIISICGISPNNINQENVESYLSPNHSIVAEFIEENLDVFKTEYNKVVTPNEYFNGNYCEHKAEVVILSEFENDEISYGTYLDFDNSNGYMLVADNYEVLLFEISGDLSYLKDVTQTYYSLYDGFGIIDEENIFIPYKSLLVEKNEDFILSKKHYNGQDDNASGNDGEIVNTDLYVEDRYGKGYSCIDDVDISQKRNGVDFDYELQYDNSLYYEKLSDNNSISEGNCALNSVFQLLNYYQKCGLCSNLPSLKDESYVDITKDYFYNNYINNTKYFMYSKNIPSLYLKIRDIAINNYGYKNDGISYFKIDDLIRTVSSEYKCSLKVDNIWFWSFQSQVKNEINKGFPILWSMANSSTYGSHTTVVTGYKQYRKIKKIWFIKIKYYVNFMQLADNWNSEKRYFDFTNYYAFGGFTKVRV